jgi:branched-chain amino acid transport system permease protein
VSDLATRAPDAGSPSLPGRALSKASLSSLRPPVYRRHPLLQVVLFAAVCALGSRQFAGDDANMHVINTWLIYTIAGAGFYLMFVLAGRFAFCQTFMMTTGGYTTAYLSRSHSFWPSLLGGVGAVVVISAVFALVCARTESFLFAVATLALGQIGAAVYVHWNDFTGPNGLSSNVPVPSPFGSGLLQEPDIFWLLFPMLLLCLLITLFVERSPVAREAAAARDMPEVARSVGIATRKIQVSLFVLGSAMGGLAGGLAAYWQGSIAPETFGLTLALGLFLIPILGGVGSVWGTVLGALLYVELPNWLAGLAKYSSLTYGLVLVLVIIALPQGLIGGLQQLLHRVVPSLAGGPSRSARVLLRRPKGGADADS